MTPNEPNKMLDWLLKETPTIASVLEIYESELPTVKHDKIRLYVNANSQQFTVISFESAMAYHPEDQEPLEKEACTHLSLVRDFPSHVHHSNWSIRLAELMVAQLEVY